MTRGYGGTRLRRRAAGTVSRDRRDRGPLAGRDRGANGALSLRDPVGALEWLTTLVGPVVMPFVGSGSTPRGSASQSLRSWTASSTVGPPSSPPGTRLFLFFARDRAGHQHAAAPRRRRGALVYERRSRAGGFLHRRPKRPESAARAAREDLALARLLGPLVHTPRSGWCATSASYSSSCFSATAASCIGACWTNPKWLMLRSRPSCALLGRGGFDEKQPHQGGARSLIQTRRRFRGKRSRHL